MSFSFSKISTFQQCPYRYKLQYLDKVDIPFETNIALEKGKFIHSMIEHHLKKSKLENYNFTLSTKKDVENYKKIVNNFLVSPLFQTLTANKEFYIERGFSIDIDKNKNIIAGDYKQKALIKGYIDYIGIKDKKAIIVDWKTGKYKKDQNELQVLTYALWAFKSFDIEKVECYFVFVEHNNFVKYEYTKDQFNQLLKRLLKEIAIIKRSEKKDYFPKKVSTLCDWCPMKKFNHCSGDYEIEKLILS